MPRFAVYIAFGAKGSEPCAVFDRYRRVSALDRSAVPRFPGVGPGLEPRWEEDTAMRLKQLCWSRLVAAVLGALVGVTAVAAGEQFLPILGIREGAVRSILIPVANGYIH